MGNHEFECKDCDDPRITCNGACDVVRKRNTELCREGVRNCPYWPKCSCATLAECKR